MASGRDRSLDAQHAITLVSRQSVGSLGVQSASNEAVDGDAQKAMTLRNQAASAAIVRSARIKRQRNEVDPPGRSLGGLRDVRSPDDVGDIILKEIILAA